MNHKLLVAVYSYPEAYPPTLNAVENLAEEFSRIDIICRNFKRDKWGFSEKVFVNETGKLSNINEIGQKSFFWKLKSFFDFAVGLFRSLKKYKHDVVLVYDPIPLFSIFIVLSFFKYKPIIWYHNHDIIDIRKVRKFSISWFAGKKEKRLFEKIDLFSLPSLDRRRFFPLEALKGDFFFLPNYPSLKIFSRDKIKSTISEGPQSIIYQGYIGEGRGIVEIIKLIKNGKFERSIKFCIKGFGAPDFLNKLKSMIVEWELSDQVYFLPFGPYEEIPKLTSRFRVGIAIHNRSSASATTLGTASNKIYEYAACGVPVLYYDNEQFNKYLENYKWAVSTNMTQSSLSSSLNYCFKNFETLSVQARMDFESTLNYETYFAPVINRIKELL